MAKFRKRPVVIEAYQTEVRFLIETLEGTMTASPGDWVITGVMGEEYPCKDEIFRKTYEPVGMVLRRSSVSAPWSWIALKTGW